MNEETEKEESRKTFKILEDKLIDILKTEKGPVGMAVMLSLISSVISQAPDIEVALNTTNVTLKLCVENFIKERKEKENG